MTIIGGLPAHALLLHFVVVLVPLIAALEIVCACWPAARRGALLWLTLILATANMVLTPVTINAGEWLYDLRVSPSPILREHAERGELMIYFSAALLAVAIGLAVLRLSERRSEKGGRATKVIVVVVTLAVGIASMVQIYRVGDAGAQSVWGGDVAHLQKAHGG
ncbi:hypothetical protein BN971_00839 [Mycobacterium bohemicum DSM 44277]|uniref:DUF2231 domain-containing protein n=2 Tax=Mycobacterium bohemicum TaxID=56425 RepID=A0A1X1R226_MYCBE|nr:DUF2231 domain-containing protein [Mycobacterium bohemicum]MCV6972144.1 hypothetical protein [Mycobacterium bohemicum]ORU98218.1 hypothetical protein AWB93_15275 [Mycobacterium bohemicum]CPR06709.1 hypothetical protein BN971_00839 [Mycobacterium bohemicum DSM 44277]